jgi:hypothetical protein
MEETRDRGTVKTKIATRFLTPIAAAAASAAAGYAVRKGPEYFERVLPRLRELAGEAENVTRDLPTKAVSVASGAGDVAQDLGDRAKALVGSGGQASNGNHRASNGNHRRFSPQELEKRREERARARAERRKPRGRTSAASPSSS